MPQGRGFGTITDMRMYEFVLVLKSSLSETERGKLLKTVKDWIKPVTVTKEEEWGNKPLSYPIKHQVSGYYQMLHLEAEAGLPKDVEKRLIDNENILRHLLIRTK